MLLNFINVSFSHILLSFDLFLQNNLPFWPMYTRENRKKMFIKEVRHGIKQKGNSVLWPFISNWLEAKTEDFFSKEVSTTEILGLSFYKKIKIMDNEKIRRPALMMAVQWTFITPFSLVVTWKNIHFLKRKKMKSRVISSHLS